MGVVWAIGAREVVIRKFDDQPRREFIEANLLCRVFKLLLANRINMKKWS